MGAVGVTGLSDIEAWNPNLDATQLKLMSREGTDPEAD